MNSEGGTFETILWERRGALGLLTLNRPESRNGIVTLMMRELHTVLQAATEDAELRVVVLTGAGRDFCPGADLKAFAGGPGSGVTPELFDIAVMLHDMPAVTIAAIRGACAGAALGWAAACDLRIASETGRFNTAFLDVGLSGDMGGTWTLPRLLGAAKARELYMLPGKFEAAEALRIGLVSRVVKDATFDAEVASVAERLASSAPLALRTIKGNFVAAEHMGFAEFVQFEAGRHSSLARTEDMKEARTAFLEKRKAVFVGR